MHYGAGIMAAGIQQKRCVMGFHCAITHYFSIALQCCSLCTRYLSMKFCLVESFLQDAKLPTLFVYLFCIS